MTHHYIDAKCFEDFKLNQGKLINVLNHSVTLIKNDIVWIKRFIGITTAILTAMLLQNWFL